MPEIFLLSYVDYLVIALMLAVSAGIGICIRMRGGEIKTNDDYLLAGRNMSIFPVAFSLMATFMTATTLMGIPSEMYEFGTHMAFMNVGFLLGPVISSVVFLPIYFENEVSTPYEYLEKRFGRSTRNILSGIFLLINVLFNGVVLYAPALALSAVTNLSIWTSVISIGVVCTFYCTIGGMKAVLWTDVFQAFLMYACLVFIIVIGWIELDGFSNIFRAAYDGGRIVLPTFEFDFSTRYSMYSVVLFGLILTVQNYGCGPLQIQRQLTIKSLRSSCKASIISAPMLVLFHLLCCMCGLIFYAYFKTCDPMTSPDHPIDSADQLMPYYVVETLSQYPGLPGLCISGIFSASLSSISSAVNSMAAVTYEDMLKPLLKDRAKSVFVTMGLSVFYGALSISMTFIVSALGNLIKATVLCAGLLAGPSLGIFLLAATTTTATEMGANFGIISGIIVGGCLTFIPNARPSPTLPVGKDCDASPMSALNDTLRNSTDYYKESTIRNGTINASMAADNHFPISFMWMSPIGLVTTIAVGFFSSWIISLVTGKVNYVPASLLSPLRRKLLSKEDASDEDIELSKSTNKYHITPGGKTHQQQSC